MFELRNASSLLEIGFAINLVAPSLFTAVRNAREGALEPILEGMKTANPDFFETRERRRHLNKMVWLFFPGLRVLRTISFFTMFISLGVCVLSVCGLMQSALHPDTKLPEQVAWAYVLGAIFFLPIVYLMLISSAGWLQSILAAKLRDDAALGEATSELFNTLLNLHESMSEIDRKFNSVMTRVDTYLRKIRKKTGVETRRSRNAVLLARVHNAQQALIRMLRPKAR